MTDSIENLDHHDIHLLVVDDDNRIRSLLKRYLGQKGFRVSIAESASTARRLMRTLAFDLIILDIMMPGEDGLSLTSSLREFDAVPIILLTAKGEASDRIEGLRRGADDYLHKPFEPEELVLRIKSILRRNAGNNRIKQLIFGPWHFDLERGVLTRDQERVKLTTGELSLLTTLARRAGTPVSRMALAENIGAKSERAVDVQITRLRRKIENSSDDPQFLITVRGQGYRLIADNANLTAGNIG